jgi:hypothetical protein
MYVGIRDQERFQCNINYNHNPINALKYACRLDTRNRKHEKKLQSAPKPSQPPNPPCTLLKQLVVCLRQRHPPYTHSSLKLTVDHQDLRRMRVDLRTRSGGVD